MGSSVRKLSNLSIDEVSLVDRGANQHATVEVAKRAPTADDVFDEVEKGEAGTTAALSAIGGPIAGFHQRRSRTGWSHGGLKTFGSSVGGGIAGASIGRAVGEAVGGSSGAAIGTTAGSLAGTAGATGMVVHHHYNMNPSPSSVNKRGPSDVPTADAYFAEMAKKADMATADWTTSSGTVGGTNGGEADELTDIDNDSDPSEVAEDPASTGGPQAAPHTTVQGETVPPGNGSGRKGVKKDAGFWSNFVDQVMSDDVGKAFPPSMGGGPVAGGMPMGMGNAMQGQAPQMMPGMQPQMGQMGQQPQMPQLPPEVVQYIQQLEQALDQAQGNTTDDSGNDNSSAGNNNGSSDGNNNPFGKSGDFNMSDDRSFLVELAKSLDAEDDAEQREVLSKAMDAVSKASQRADAAEQIAKSERNLRLEREFISKAAEFNLPVSPAELGPVLKRASESLPLEDVAVIVKCLRSASAQMDASNTNLFGEVGKAYNTNGSIFDEIEQAANEFSKSSTSREDAFSKALNDNPHLYDEYLASRRGR